MRIIIEGCDGTGKTTLAKLYAEKYGLDICHCTQHDPSDYDFYRNTIRKNNVVWDRHTIGELIYPKVFNRTAQISPEDARLALSYGRELGAKILVLTSPIDIIKSRLKERGGECDEILDKIEWIDNQFKFYADQFNVPVINTSVLSLQQLYDLVEREENFEFIHK